MIYPNKPLYLLSLLGYIYYLTYYTLTTKDNIISFLLLIRLIRYHIYKYKYEYIYPYMFYLSNPITLKYVGVVCEMHIIINI